MPIQKILVVDDSATERRALGDLLIRQGYQVAYAATGDEAIAAACAERPDLILMDVLMPGLDGLRATRAIHQDRATAAIPVVILSSRNHAADRRHGERAGARHWLAKPVTQAALLAVLKEFG